jgi:hypothetical protein
VILGACDGRGAGRKVGLLVVPDAFSSSDVFLLAVAEHADMLIAHEVSPFDLIDDGESSRAEVGTSLRLAASRFGRILL